MGIGVSIGAKGIPIVDRLPTSIVYPSLEAAIAAGEVVIQGSPQAVTPMADLATGRLAPEVPGGLQMRRSMVILDGTPVLLPDLAALPPPPPPPPPPTNDRLTDGAGNYLTDGASSYLAT